MIGMRSLVEPTHARKWIRVLDVRVKIGLVLAVSVLVVLIDAPWTLAGILGVVAALYAVSGFPGTKLRLAAGIVLLTVWGTMLAQALFYASVPRTAVLELIPKDFPVLGGITGGLCIYREGLAYGAVQSLRIVTMIGLGLLVCWTTDPGQFLGVLVRLKVPYGVAFMTVTALRFLPVVVSETQVVATARRMKGYHLRRWTSLRPVRRLIEFTAPVFANAIRRSRALAVSVESRAFDPVGGRSVRATGATPLRFSGVAILALLGAVVLAVAAAKLLHWMFLEEIYYSSALRGVYDFVRTYL
jgi:energy-coupling factor transport system permease protein